MRIFLQRTTTTKVEHPLNQSISPRRSKTPKSPSTNKSRESEDLSLYIHGLLSHSVFDSFTLPRFTLPELARGSTMTNWIYLPLFKV
uniref:Uncharacterized protein n=1 Tax=Megaselia scalaris TaxID=36166 RepID=T1GYW8_MEGSC